MSLGYGNKLGHASEGTGLVVGWGNSTQIVVLGQTLLHLYKITENRDGRKLTIQYNPPALLSSVTLVSHSDWGLEELR